MHGVVGKPPGAAANYAVATSKIMLLMLVAMTGVAPISLYMLVPALPVLATTFGGDISVAQMTVSLYMVGIACSQLIMGPLSDKFGRRPVLLAGLALMVAASIGCSLAQTLPQLIAARFLQALGGATGMVVSRAIIRDLYSRDRISSMISLVIAVMMMAQMLSALVGGLLETAFGWRAIFYFITAASLSVAVLIAIALPETRRDRGAGSGFRGDVGKLIRDRAFHRLCAVPGAGFADHLHLCRRRALHRGDADGPNHRRIWRLVRDNGICVSDRQPVLRPLRAAPFAGEADLVRAGAAIRRRAAEPDLQHRRDQPVAGSGCSAPR